MESTKSNRKFNAEFPATNPQAYHKSNGEKALAKAKKLHNIKVNDGLVAVRDSKTKSIRFVKITKENLSN